MEALVSAFVPGSRISLPGMHLMPSSRNGIISKETSSSCRHHMLQQFVSGRKNRIHHHHNSNNSASTRRSRLSIRNAYELEPDDSSSDEGKKNKKMVDRYRRSVYDHEAWENHRSSLRHGRTILSMAGSKVILALGPPVLGLTVVAAVLASYNEAAQWILPSCFPLLHVSALPFQLLAPALALLLVFRTNASYARFDEARRALGSNVNRTRDITRQALCWIRHPEDAHRLQKLLRHCIAKFRIVLGMKQLDDERHVFFFTHDLKTLSLMDQCLLPGEGIVLGFLKVARTSLRLRKRALVLVHRVLRGSCVAYSYCVKHHMLKEGDLGEDLRDVLEDEELNAALGAHHRPNFCLMTMSEIINSCTVSETQQALMSENITKFFDNLGACERIFKTPIPLSYTRLTSRLLVIWHVALPLALWDQCKWAVVPATSLSAAVLFCIEEVGVLIEEPFQIFPFEILCTLASKNVETLTQVHEDYLLQSGLEGDSGEDRK